jgi:hypothetical protein
MNKKISVFLIFLFALLSGCEKETENPYIDLLPGFWTQSSITIDGVNQNLTPCEQSTRLLIEQNGIYRLYSSCDVVQRPGTWLISNDDMLDLSMDRRNGASYFSFPVRFTILEVTSNSLEIRIKTYVGERKRTVMFTPLPPDDTTQMTAEERLALDQENKTIQTYIYRFTKN